MIKRLKKLITVLLPDNNQKKQMYAEQEEMITNILEPEPEPFDPKKPIDLGFKIPTNILAGKRKPYIEYWYGKGDYGMERVHRMHIRKQLLKEKKFQKKVRMQKMKQAHEDGYFDWGFINSI